MTGVSPFEDRLRALDSRGRNMRWVLVCARKGNIALMEPAQGRFTYDTADEAYARLSAIVTGNSREVLLDVYGPHFFETKGIRRVECWPRHNDPVACVFEPFPPAAF